MCSCWSNVGCYLGKDALPSEYMGFDNYNWLVDRVNRVLKLMGCKEIDINERLNKCDDVVKQNIPTLEEWSGLKYKQVLYDSDIDGKSSEIFRNKILKHKQLYFIVKDSEGNVFGHNHSSNIHEFNVDIDDKNIFMFKLSNENVVEI